ncbi:HTH-type transcriptional activator RhaS [Clostridium saccharobutylicum]|uniref:AraC family transcriptional regulator n=1 Tax=Clostridium saccharobutylicum TaxID=169679 RepID=UPI000983B9B9|nr:AraC family transcriptional regulator [Clostridium saccharobutylicum]AQS11424.1 HTH-type transcriptional activator RhaS [Clostridium saccharobutylicum]MBC2435172.1 AraC family transcriptional regulator [Clostridium saccharobutylicum]NSB88651.1 AraC-like DNA-binding protein [Clostridium saccharobutylicum]NYC30596.1 AraC-like DNA-binding protein [Clostridium saccharobutylicum]OOM12216.1 HTH-type transcriptional activator RhaS [Clostridium saccharobutylicum]
MLKYESYHFGENNLFSYYNPHDLNYPKHLHRSFEFIYVTNGNIEVSVNNRTFNIPQNSCILILPYEVHSIATKKYSDANICVFPPEYVETFHNMIDGKTLENPVFNLSTNTEALVLDKIFKDNLNLLQMKGCLYLLCSEIIEHTKLLDSIKHDYELLHKTLTYVQENFTKNISLKSISSEFGYSYTYLSKYLNNILGTSLVNFINENRINYALYLLKNSQATITDIAYTCGYSSIRSFNRNFLRLTGKTPKSYRVVQ